MQHLRWTAAVPALLGLIFVFFGLIWLGVVQLIVAAGLFATAGLIWRATTGEWPRIST